MPAVELTRDEMRKWARAYAVGLEAPAVVTLRGDLGAGKTTMVQEMAAALGVTDEVTSPTYALVHEYQSPLGPVHHFDLYRLRDASQLAQLAWDEIVYGKGIVFVEWPERAEGALPPHAMAIAIEHLPYHPDSRIVTWG